MLTFADISARLQNTFRTMAQDLTHTRLDLYNLKAAAAAPVGATQISLTGIPAGMDRVLPGDSVGFGRIIFTTQVFAINGTITDAQIQSALTAPIAIGSAIQVIRTTNHSCKGFVEGLENKTTSTGLPDGDYRITILTDTLGIKPRISDGIEGNGSRYTIHGVGSDPAGCAWVLFCSFGGSSGN